MYLARLEIYQREKKTAGVSRREAERASIHLHGADHHIRVRDHEHGEPGCGDSRLRPRRAVLLAPDTSVRAGFGARQGRGRDSHPGLLLECLQEQEYVSRRFCAAHVVDADREQFGPTTFAEPAVPVLASGSAIGC